MLQTTDLQMKKHAHRIANYEVKINLMKGHETNPLKRLRNKMVELIFACNFRMSISIRGNIGIFLHASHNLIVI